MISVFRYPGGKRKLSPVIVDKLLESNSRLDYREPFLGAGSILLSLLKESNLKSIWMNDKDVGIASFWTAVVQEPENLIGLIDQYQPSVDDFFQFKERLLSATEISLEHAFMKLAIHQISYSGLGVKSGGPLGGTEQLSRYKIDCRWSPKNLAKKIIVAHKLLATTRVRFDGCTNYGWEDLLDGEEECLIYLDPPYFEKGNELYQHGFSQEEHYFLSEKLRQTKTKWVLSYDDCPQIRELYGWAILQPIDVNYTINGSTTKGELLIYAN